MTARPFVATLLVAAACGGPGASADTSSAARPSADTAPAGPPLAATPTLRVGGRYETQPGTIVCPTPTALRHALEVAQGGDAGGFEKALTDGGCSPVNAAATVTVAEQSREVARIKRAGDTSTYWALADKLSPR